VELKDYFRPLLKWWWLLLISTLLAGVGSYFFLEQQPAVYQTQATVMVGRVVDNPNPSYNELYLTQQLANSYAEILRRQPVREATMQALGLDRLPDYVVRVVPNSQLIEIVVRDTNPRRAQAVANELVNQLILQSPAGTNNDEQNRIAFINAQLDELEAGIKDTQAEIAKKQSELANMFSARQIADAEAQIAALEQKLQTLQANYGTLVKSTEQGSINTINVVEPAYLPARPVNSNWPASVALAAAIGFSLAAGAAYFLEYIDDTLKDQQDVLSTLGLTTIGSVPPAGKHERKDGTVVDSHEPSPVAEAYRKLRTNLQFISVDQPLRTIVVSSPSPDEGKTFNVANLGVALALVGRKVIVVDADMRRPRLNEVFGVSNGDGLSTALSSGDNDFAQYLKLTRFPGLSIMTAGPPPPNPSDLLESRRMQALIANLRQMAEVVIIDSPPVLVFSDALVLATRSDGVILVVEAGKTRRQAARQALEAFDKVRANVVGVLLNRLAMRTNVYDSYYSKRRR
jgi:capsular exopolysaccharide synthesis family protein